MFFIEKGNSASKMRNETLDIRENDKMMKIAICDKEEQYLTVIERSVSEFLEKRKIHFEIRRFISGEELLEEGENEYKIVFMDVGLEDQDGIMTARRIRDFSEETVLVFVTECRDYALAGYKLNVIRYILKDNDGLENEIKECMHCIMKRAEYVSRYHLFSFVEGERYIDVSDIIYVESDLHKLVFYMKECEQREYTMYRTLNEIEDRLKPHNFLRVHQSYLVNISCITSLTRYQVVLDNGSKLPVPKNKYKKIKEFYMANRSK